MRLGGREGSSKEVYKIKWVMEGERVERGILYSRSNFLVGGITVTWVEPQGMDVISSTFTFLGVKVRIFW